MSVPSGCCRAFVCFMPGLLSSKSHSLQTSPGGSQSLTTMFRVWKSLSSSAERGCLPFSTSIFLDRFQPQCGASTAAQCSWIRNTLFGTATATSVRIASRQIRKTNWFKSQKYEPSTTVFKRIFAVSPILYRRSYLHIQSPPPPWAWRLQIDQWSFYAIFRNADCVKSEWTLMITGT